MLDKATRYLGCSSIAALSLATAFAAEPDLAQTERALDLISKFANTMCSSPELRGKSSEVDVNAAAKAEVSKLVKKIADLKIEAGTKFQSTEYQGLLQRDLLEALKDSANCKQNIYNDLKDRVLPSRLKPDASKQKGGQTASKANGASAPSSRASSAASAVTRSRTATAPHKQTGDPKKVEASAATSSRPRLALLIANENYTHIGRLQNPASDARAIANQLEKMGFRTIIKSNLTKDETVRVFSEFRSLLSLGGIGLVYYSGHGFRHDDSNYIVPINVEPQGAEDAVKQSFNVSNYLKPLDNILGVTPDSTGDVTLFAGEDEVLDGINGDANNSPFAAALIEALRSNETDISDVARLVSRRTAELTKGKQTPFLQMNLKQRFDFSKPEYDQSIGVTKIFMFDACRTNPWK